VNLIEVRQATLPQRREFGAGYKIMDVFAQMLLDQAQGEGRDVEEPPLEWYQTSSHSRCFSKHTGHGFAVLCSIRRQKRQYTLTQFPLSSSSDF
jgi:hypothetical protein